MQYNSRQELIEGADALHSLVSSTQRQLLGLIAEIDRREAWRDSGARDLPHWLSMRYSISQWKARRWVAAAHALQDLPRISEAISNGELGIDKVVELSRFATSESEARLVPWARGVSIGAIRRKGDLAARQDAEDAQDVARSRSLSWWYFDEGRRFGLEAELPAAQGAVVAKTLERLADTLPVMPDEEDVCYAQARRADALVVLCSSGADSDADPDRATVIVHARFDGLLSGVGGGEIEDGPVIPAESARRLACNARIQVVIEDDASQPIHVGRVSREPPAWMLRQLRYRDTECRFPGCGSRRFTQAHHVVWWRHGGRTDLQNLVLICSFHHRLVHEHGWRLHRARNGTVRWFRPDGRRYCAGPAPPQPRRRIVDEPVPLAIGF